MATTKLSKPLNHLFHGAWVAPDGRVIQVEDAHEHGSVGAKEAWRFAEHERGKTYTTLYNRGYIHITFDKDRDNPQVRLDVEAKCPAVAAAVKAVVTVFLNTRERFRSLAIAIGNGESYFANHFSFSQTTLTEYVREARKKLPPRIKTKPKARKAA